MKELIDLLMEDPRETIIETLKIAACVLLAIVFFSLMIIAFC